MAAFLPGLDEVKLNEEIEIGDKAMFWKVIRWGGTALVIIMVAIALASAPNPGGSGSSRSTGEQGLRIR